jgi:heme A synthase
LILRRTPGTRTDLAFRIVALASLVSAFAQVTLGGVVRVANAGLGCPDWPLCHGRLIPPFELLALIEYSHRLSASVLGVLVLATAILAWVFYRSSLWLSVPSTLGLVLVVAASGLGGATVLTELAWWVVLFHLGIAEGVVACMAIVSVVAWKALKGQPAVQREVTMTDGFERLVLAAVVGVFVLIMSGSYMVGHGYGSSCGTWPLCRDSLFPDGEPYLTHMAHRFVTAAVGVVLAATVFGAWSARRKRPDVAWTGLTLGTLFIAQALVGAGTVWAGFATEMKALHLSVATAVWLTVASLAVLVHSPLRFGPGGPTTSPKEAAAGTEGSTP